MAVCPSLENLICCNVKNWLCIYSWWPSYKQALHFCFDQHEFCSSTTKAENQNPEHVNFTSKGINNNVLGEKQLALQNLRNSPSFDFVHCEPTLQRDIHAEKK